MSVREEIAEKEKLLDRKQGELNLALEGLKAAQVNADFAQNQLEAATGVVDEYQESVDNLQKEYNTIDDEITDLKDARTEQSVMNITCPICGEEYTPDDSYCPIPKTEIPCPECEAGMR